MPLPSSSSSVFIIDFVTACSSKESIDNEIRSFVEIKDTVAVAQMRCTPEKETINVDLENFKYFWNQFLSTKIFDSPSSFPRFHKIAFFKRNFDLEKTNIVMEGLRQLKQILPSFKEFSFHLTQFSPQAFVSIVNNNETNQTMPVISFAECTLDDNYKTIVNASIFSNNDDKKSFEFKIYKLDFLNLQQAMEVINIIQTYNKQIGNHATSLSVACSSLSTDAYSYLVSISGYKKGDIMMEIDKEKDSTCCPFPIHFRLCKLFSENEDITLSPRLRGTISHGYNNTLYLNRYQIGAEEAQFLSHQLHPVLARKDQPKCLNFSDSFIDIEALQYFGSFYDVCDEIHFEVCNLTHDELLLDASIGNMKWMKSNKNDNNNDDDDDDDDGALAAFNGPILEVTEDSEEEDHIQIIMQLLGHYPPFSSTKQLNIESSELCNEQMECIAEKLNETQLQVISLGCGNFLMDDSIVALANALKYNTNLIKFDIEENEGRISSTGLKALGDVLVSDNMTLSFFSLGENNHDNDPEYSVMMERVKFYVTLNKFGRSNLLAREISSSFFGFLLDKAGEEYNPSVMYWLLQACPHMIPSHTAAAGYLGQKRKA